MKNRKIIFSALLAFTMVLPGCGGGDKTSEYFDILDDALEASIS